MEGSSIGHAMHSANAGEHVLLRLGPCWLCGGTGRTLYFGTGLYAVEKPCSVCGDPDGPVLPTIISAVRS